MSIFRLPPWIKDRSEVRIFTIKCFMLKVQVKQIQDFIALFWSTIHFFIYIEDMGLGFKQLAHNSCVEHSFYQ